MEDWDQFKAVGSEDSTVWDSFAPIEDDEENGFSKGLISLRSQEGKKINDRLISEDVAAADKAKEHLVQQDEIAASLKAAGAAANNSFTAKLDRDVQNFSRPQEATPSTTLPNKKPETLGEWTRQLIGGYAQSLEQDAADYRKRRAEDPDYDPTLRPQAGDALKNLGKNIPLGSPLSPLRVGLDNPEAVTGFARGYIGGVETAGAGIRNVGETLERGGAPAMLTGAGESLEKLSGTLTSVGIPAAMPLQAVAAGLKSLGTGKATEGPSVLKQLGEAVQKQGAYGSAAIPKAKVNSLEEIGWNPAKVGDYAMAKIGEGLGSSAIFMTGGAVGGLPGAGLASFSLGVGEVRQEIDRAGITDPELIDKYTYVAGTSIALLDSIVPAKLMTSLSSGVKKEFGKYAMGKVIKSTMQDAASEGITEAMQEAISIAAVAEAKGDQAAIDAIRELESKQESWVANPEHANERAAHGLLALEALGKDWKRIAEAGVAGALPGAAMGATGALAQSGGDILSSDQQRARDGSQKAKEASTEAKQESAKDTKQDKATVPPEAQAADQQAQQDKVTAETIRQWAVEQYGQTARVYQDNNEFIVGVSRPDGSVDYKPVPKDVATASTKAAPTATEATKPAVVQGEGFTMSDAPAATQPAAKAEEQPQEVGGTVTRKTKAASAKEVANAPTFPESMSARGTRFQNAEPKEAVAEKSATEAAPTTEPVANSIDTAEEGPSRAPDAMGTTLRKERDGNAPTFPESMSARSPRQLKREAEARGRDVAASKAEKNAAALTEDAFYGILESSAALNTAAIAKKLGVSTEEVGKLAAKAEKSGWLTRTPSGKLRRAHAKKRPSRAEIKGIQAMAVSPAVIAGDTVDKTPAVAEKYADIKAAVETAAAKILPAAVRVKVVDAIKIATQRAVDQLLSVKGVSNERLPTASLSSRAKGISDATGGTEEMGTADAGESGTAGSVRTEGQRIVRQESAALGADGEIIAGRRSTEAGPAEGGGRSDTIQRPGVTEKFSSVAGMPGFVTAIKLSKSEERNGILAKLTYRFYDKDNAPTTDGIEMFSANPQAQFELTQHEDGAWEFGWSFLAPEIRKKGIGTKAYNAMEKDLGIRFSPSGTLTDDGYAFWKKRSPASVQWHKPSPLWTGMYSSPRNVAEEFARVGRELNNLTSDTEFKKSITSKFLKDLIDNYMSDRKKLLKALVEMPPEAKAAKDSMFALPQQRKNILSYTNGRVDDSVVDNPSNVVRVYHGTTKDIQEFDPQKSRNAHEKGAIFVTPSSGLAENWASAYGGNIIPLNVKIGKSRILDVATEIYSEEFQKEMIDAVNDSLRARGFSEEEIASRGIPNTIDKINEIIERHKKDDELNAEIAKEDGTEITPLTRTVPYHQAFTAAAIKIGKRDGLDTIVIRNMREGANATSPADQIVVLSSGTLTSAISNDKMFALPEAILANESKYALSEDEMAKMASWEDSPELSDEVNMLNWKDMFFGGITPTDTKRSTDETLRIAAIASSSEPLLDQIKGDFFRWRKKVPEPMLQTYDRYVSSVIELVRAAHARDVGVAYKKLADAVSLANELRGDAPTPLMKNATQFVIAAANTLGVSMAMRRGVTEALGQTNPNDMLISLGMRAIELEAAMKGKTPIEEALRVFRHEVLEFFKAFGDDIFTPGEWKTLERAARKLGWVESTHVRDAYESLYKGKMSDVELEQILLKEAIAEQYSEYLSERKTYPKGIEGLFARLKDFIARISNALQGMGFNTYEDVFQKINRGEFKSRFEEAFPEQSQTTSAEGMQLPGSTRIPDALTPAAKPGTDKPQMSLTEIRDAVVEMLGLEVRRGRLDEGLKRAATKSGGELLGQYDPETDIIRVRELNNVEVIFHEAGHERINQSFKDRFGAEFVKAISAYAAELEALDPSGQQILSEGFADFFRRYLLNNRIAKAKAPGFYAEFERLVKASNPGLLSAMQEIQKRVEEYQKSSSAGRVMSSTKSTVKMGGAAQAIEDIKKYGPYVVMKWAKDFRTYLQRVYNSRVSDTNWIHLWTIEVAKNAERNNKTLDFSFWKNPAKQAQQLNNAHSIGWADLTEGVHFIGNIRKGAVSFHDALTLAFGGEDRAQWSDEMLNAFGSYLTARRGRWLWLRFQPDAAQQIQGTFTEPPQGAFKNGQWFIDASNNNKIRVWLNGRWEDELPHAPDKNSRADHEQTVASLEAEHPQFEEAAQLVYKFMRDWSLKEYQAGFLTEKAFSQRMQENDYVPWFRIMDKDGVFGSSNQGRKTPRNFRLQGSYRDFINPIESITRMVFEGNYNIKLNDMKRTMQDVAMASGVGYGHLAEPLSSTEARGTKYNMFDALMSEAKKRGVTDVDAQSMLNAVIGYVGNDGNATIFKRGEINERGDQIIYYLRKGKVEVFALANDDIGKGVFHFFQTLGDAPDFDSLVSWLAWPGKLMQIGITAHPRFQIWNLMRDQYQAPAMVPGYWPLISNAKTAIDNWYERRSEGGTPWNERLASHAGIMAGMNSMAEMNLRTTRDIEAMRRKGVTFNPVKSDFWLGTINPASREFWKWTEWSESSTRQTIARIEFKHSKKELAKFYPGMPKEELEYLALEEAVFKSSNYVPYNRGGEKMHWLRQIVRFMNAGIQGLDRAFKVALLAEMDSGQWATPRAISKKTKSLVSLVSPWMKHVNNEPLTAAEKKALGRAFRYWAVILTIAMIQNIIRAFGDDDDDALKEELTDYQDTTYVHFTMPFTNDVVAFVPRGFDFVGATSNAMSAAYDAQWKKDPTAKSKFVDSALRMVIPAHSIAGADMYSGIFENYNRFTDRPVVSDYLKAGRVPEDQHSPWIDPVSMSIGKNLGVSPNQVSFLMSKIGTQYYNDITKIAIAASPNRESLHWWEYPIVSSFFRDPSKYSKSKEKYYDVVREYTQFAGSYAQTIGSRDPLEVKRYLDNMDPEVRAYVVAREHLDADQKHLHPLMRMQAISDATNGIMRDIVTDRLPQAGDKKKTEDYVVLSPTEKRDAFDALRGIEMREMRRTLVLLGTPGWAQKRDDLLPPDKYYEQLKTALPKVWDIYQERTHGGRGGRDPKVYNFDYMKKTWPAVRRGLLDQSLQAEIVAARGNVDLKTFRSEAREAQSLSR